MSEATAAAPSTIAPPITAADLKIAPPRALRPPLNASRYQHADQARVVHRITVEEGTEPEDLLQPSFYAGIWQHLHAFDEITAVPDNETWYARVLVRQVGPGFAKVHIQSVDRFDDTLNASVAENGFTVAWKGPKRRWIVTRDSDNAILREDFKSKAEALIFIEQHRN